MWHTPEAITGIPDLEQHYEAVDNQITKIRQEINRLDEDNFFENMSEGRVARWERVLHLTPKSTDTLDERRFAVETSVTDTLPYTYIALCNELKAMAGASTTIGRYFDGYGMVLEVSVGVGSASMVNAIGTMLDKKLPLDVVYTVTVRYTPYYVLEAYRHNQLRQYTHDELRSLIGG